MCGVQPYNEVFDVQRFRECELIHGRWCMMATLGAVVAELNTGVSWVRPHPTHPRLSLTAPPSRPGFVVADLDRREVHAVYPTRGDDMPSSRHTLPHRRGSGMELAGGISLERKHP